MPAEWEPHEATWLAWPHERTDWPGKFAPIPCVYADIVRHLARVERVRILVQDRAEERAARRILQKSGADLSAVDFFIAPSALVVMLAAVLLISTLASIIPALRASRVRIADMLRYE